MLNRRAKPIFAIRTRACRRRFGWCFCSVLFAYLVTLSLLPFFTLRDVNAKDPLHGLGYSRLPFWFRDSRRQRSDAILTASRRKILEQQHVCYGETYEKCFEIVGKFILDRMTGPSRPFAIRDGRTIVIQRNNNGAEEVLHDWKTGLGLPLIGMNAPVKMKVVQAYAYNSSRLRDEGYFDVRDIFSDFSLHRFPELTLRPRKCSSGPTKATQAPWLAQFSNVWVSGNGIVLVPIRERRRGAWEAYAFDIAGGCCEHDWVSVLGKEILMGDADEPEPVAFSLGQYHGVTYHHSIAEILPRFLSFWPLLRSSKSIRLILSRSYASKPDVLRYMLEALGWPRERTIALDEMEFHPVERLFVPAPFYQDAQYDSKCLEEVSSDLFRQIVRAPVDALATKGKPLLLLIDRASSRKEGQSPTCRLRCVGNLGEIEQALKREFGDQLAIRIMRKKSGNSVIQSVSEFKLARIVVGAHGAAFQNMMFMDRGGDAIQISWEDKYYAPLAKRWDIHFETIMVKDAAWNAGNFWVNVNEVVSAVGKIVNSSEFADGNRKIREPRAAYRR